MEGMRMDEDYLQDLREVITHLHLAGLILENVIKESDCPSCAKQEKNSLDFTEKAHHSLKAIFDTIARREARQP
jgi:hypothetical protein